MDFIQGQYTEDELYDYIDCRYVGVSWSEDWLVLR